MYVTLLVANCRVGDANARIRYPLTGAEMKHISLQGKRNVIKTTIEVKFLSIPYSYVQLQLLNLTQRDGNID